MPLVAVTTVALASAAGAASASVSHAAGASTGPGRVVTSSGSIRNSGSSVVHGIMQDTLISGLVDASDGLNIHSGSPTGWVIDVMPYYSVATLNCWVYGPAITGPGGTTSVWDSVESYTTPWGTGVTFVGPGGPAFASDAWLDTGGDSSTMLPYC